MSVLGKINRETGGSVEAHIYSRFIDRHLQLHKALEYCNTSSPKNFDVKISVDEELAEDITSNISSDRVIIVCRDAEKNIILSLLTQIGWRSHIQSIITEQDFTLWYEKALRGRYANLTGEKLLSCLREETAGEFPVTSKIPDILKSRHYEKLSPLMKV